MGPGPTNIDISESRAQSVLQQMEEEFRAELEEKQHIIAALNTKVGFRESKAQSVLQQMEEEFRAELEENQHIIAALNTKVGLGSPRLKVYGTPANGGGVQGRAGGEAAHHCSTQH